MLLWVALYHMDGVKDFKKDTNLFRVVLVKVLLVSSQGLCIIC